MQETSVHTGWLSPTGEFIQCNTYAHIKTADEIYSKFTGSSKCTSTPDRELLKLGWVSISLQHLQEDARKGQDDRRDLRSFRVQDHCRRSH